MAIQQQATFDDFLETVNTPAKYWNTLNQWRNNYEKLKKEGCKKYEAKELLDRGAELLLVGDENGLKFKNEKKDEDLKRIFQAFDRTFNVSKMLTELMEMKGTKVPEVFKRAVRCRPTEEK